MAGLGVIDRQVVVALPQISLEADHFGIGLNQLLTNVARFFEGGQGVGWSPHVAIHATQVVVGGGQVRAILGSERAFVNDLLIEVASLSKAIERFIPPSKALMKNPHVVPSVGHLDLVRKVNGLMVK